MNFKLRINITFSLIMNNPLKEHLVLQNPYPIYLAYKTIFIKP